jgi:hypothetical protein
MEANYKLFDDKSKDKIATPNSNVIENLDDIMSSMEFDKFKEKDAYDKD